MKWFEAAHEVLDLYAANEKPSRDLEKAAVKASLARLVELAPGRAVEVRIPPHAAVQVIGGTSHRRGTPPAVVECDGRTWLSLATGAMSWHDGLMSGKLHASGARSDLSGLLPIPNVPLDYGHTDIP